MVKVWTEFLLFCAAASVVAWAVALCRENRVCPFGAAARFVRGLPWGGRLSLLPLFAALIAYGSVKNSGELKVVEWVRMLCAWIWIVGRVRQVGRVGLMIA